MAALVPLVPFCNLHKVVYSERRLSVHLQHVNIVVNEFLVVSLVAESLQKYCFHVITGVVVLFDDEFRLAFHHLLLHLKFIH